MSDDSNETQKTQSRFGLKAGVMLIVVVAAVGLVLNLGFGL
jgi:hypothetical protein